MTRVLLAVLAALLLTPAATAGARTIHEDLAAAHAYWGNDLCADQWQVTPDTLEARHVRRGAATGIAFTHNPVSGIFESEGTRWDWHVDRCEFTMDPTIQGCERAAIVRHEVGHFIHGPSHTGPMAPHAVDNAACPIKQKTSRKLRARSARLKAKAAKR